MPTGFDTTNFLFRVDHRINETNQLTARYNLYDIESLNARNVGGLNAVSRGTALEDRDQTFAASLVSTLSPRTLNEARFQYTRSRLGAPVNDEAGPAINISGVANLGTATFSPTARDLDTYELVDNVTTQRGAHSLKAGTNFLLNRVRHHFPRRAARRLHLLVARQLSGGALRDVPAGVRRGRPVPVEPERRPLRAGRVEAAPRPDAQPGLRYDAQFLPDPIETDANNFAPRVGAGLRARLPWPRTQDGHPRQLRHLLRPPPAAGHVERAPARRLEVPRGRALLRAGGSARLPDVLTEFPSNLLVSITTIDPNIRNAYSQQASLQVERELSGAMSALGRLPARAGRAHHPLA